MARDWRGPRYLAWGAVVVALTSLVTIFYYANAPHPGIDPDTAAYLRQASQCHFLRYEDLVAEPQREMARLSQFLGHDVTGQAIDAAMAVGSQKGTRLESVSEKGLARWQAMKDEVDRVWAASGTTKFYSRIMEDPLPRP